MSAFVSNEVVDLARAVGAARAAAEGDSNDAEIEALQEALELALRRWPEVDSESGRLVPPPDVRLPLVAGVHYEESREGKRHIATEANTGACAPGPVRPLPLHEELIEAASVYDEQRCGRPGCRRHWAKVPGRDRDQASLPAFRGQADR